MIEPFHILRTQSALKAFKRLFLIFITLALSACDPGPGLLPSPDNNTGSEPLANQPTPTTVTVSESTANSGPAPETYSKPAPIVPGLFYTAEELKIWNNRRLNGVYKTHWDSRISPNAQLFMDGTKDSAPWPGQVSQSCWDTTSDNHPDINGPQGMWANSAAFVFRILDYAEDKNANQYLEKVRKYLLSHTDVAGLDFSDDARWCIKSLQKQGSMQFMGAWLRRLAVTYSWVRNDLTESDRERFETWLNTAGNYIVRHTEWFVSTSFTNRYNDKYICDGKFCPGALSKPEILYSGGPKHYQIHDNWNNRAAAVASAAGIIGILTNDVVLTDKGARFFKESLRYAVWPDGTYVDIIRTSPGATNAFSYPMVYLGSMCSLADALARVGDRSLYDYSTSIGFAGTESTTGQPPKSIRSVIMHLAGQVDGTIIKYGSGKDHVPDNIINTTNTGGYGDGSISDIFMAQSNIYYRNQYITSIYTRTAPGAPPRPQYTSSGFDQFTGDWGTYPDVIFMFGGMEGKVWPYPADVQDRTNEH